MAKKILVVDDEELITKTLLRLLGTEGYDVAIAQSGAEALDKVKTVDFDLIISDVRMPELDGIRTIKEIRAYLKGSKRKTPPEVLITGYADVDKYEQAMGLKVAEYLHKPFENAQFLEIVKKTIS